MAESFTILILCNNSWYQWNNMWSRELEYRRLIIKRRKLVEKVMGRWMRRPGVRTSCSSLERSSILLHNISLSLPMVHHNPICCLTLYYIILSYFVLFGCLHDSLNKWMMKYSIWVCSYHCTLIKSVMYFLVS